MKIEIVHLRLLADSGKEPGGWQCADYLSDRERVALGELLSSKLVGIRSSSNSNAVPIARTEYSLTTNGLDLLKSALEVMNRGR
jgi:hypothetical protein